MLSEKSASIWGINDDRFHRWGDWRSADLLKFRAGAEISLVIGIAGSTATSGETPKIDDLSQNPESPGIEIHLTSIDIWVW